MKHNYKTNSQPIQACFRDVYLIGDSSVRELFTDLESRWGQPGDHEPAPVHANLSFTVDDGQSVDFVWDPYLNQTHLADLRNAKTGLQAGVEQSYSPTSVVVGAGFWHARYLDNAYDEQFDNDVHRLLTTRLGLRRSEAQPIFLPIIPPYFPRLNHERSATLTPRRVDKINSLLYTLSREHNVDLLLAALPATQRHAVAYQSDGLHHTPLISTMQLEILTARLCPLAYDHSCCSKAAEMPSQQVLAICAAGAVVCLWLFATRGASFAPTVRLTQSLWPVTQASGVIAGTVCYCALADRTSFFERATKLVDEQLFCILCYMALVAGLLTVGRCRDDHILIHSRTWADEVLPRKQTEEWKGWMQIVILLYHYFGMSHTLWVYRVIRLLVASYLFLTGYGHAAYFIKTNNFSLRRLAAVLVRINTLSCVLPFLMNTHYQLYYFPMLASFWFLVTWATIPRSSLDGVSLGVSTVAIVCSVSILELLSTVWLVDGFFALLFHIGMTSFEFREYKFRISLDFYVPYVGMIVALVVALAKEQREGSEWLHIVRWRNKQYLWLVAGLAAIVYFVSVSFLSIGRHGKERFNSYHPLLSCIPILAYVVLRNATPSLRNHYSRFFAWFGRHSLETFVLQYHIWLAADTRGILHLGLIDKHQSREHSTKGSWRFWAEVIIITAIFLWVSQATTKATSVLVDWIAPSPVNEAEKTDIKCEDNAGPLWPPTPGAVWRNMPAMSEESKLRGKVAAVLLLLWLVNASWPACLRAT